MKIYYSVILASLICLFNFLSAAYAEEHRLKIQIFRYVKAEKGDKADAYEQFYRMLQDKTRIFYKDLDKKNIIDQKVNYLKELKISKPLEDTIPDATNLHEHWDNQRALEVMTGNIWYESQQKYYLAQSRIYLGDLGKECHCLSEPSVVVELPITRYEFGHTLDSHSLITFIALALDSIRTDDDSSALTASLLAVAKEKLEKLKDKLTSANFDLLQSAIENAQKHIKAKRKDKKPKEGKIE